MLGIIYLILAWFVGYHFLKKFLPMLFKLSKSVSLLGKPIRLDNWMVTFPGGFLVGTLLITWFTYLSTWCIAKLFPTMDKPLIYGDLLSFALLVGVSTYVIVKQRKNYSELIKNIRTSSFSKLKTFVSSHVLELCYILVIVVIWSIYMFRSLYIKDGTINVGISVFSDFGATLPIIRSFSLGSNFPTEYPHFAGGIGSGVVNDIRYHFLFQFLAGNLELLGLRFDWAFNLPSILSIVSFLMLLYAFTVMVFGKRIIAIIASVLFFFRSSLAFFTAISAKEAEGITSIKDLVKYLSMTGLPHLSPDRTPNIGLTEHEGWGFWAQKVYVNKRHYAFALGIAMLTLIVVFPLFRRMIRVLKSVKTKVKDKIKMDNIHALESLNVSDVALSPVEDSTVNELNTNIEVDETPDKLETVAESNKNSVLNFALLYIKYWIKEFVFSKDAWVPGNWLRPFVIGIILGLTTFWNGAVVIAVLPVLALIAVFSKRRLEFLIIATLAVVLSVAQSMFFTNGASGNPELFIGFLVAQGNNVPLREQLPVIANYFLELLGILPFALLACLFAVPRGGRWLALAFISPIVLATTYKFSVDVGANHVIIIFSIILLNIVIANLLYRLFTSKSLVVGIVGLASIGLLFYLMARQFDFDTLVKPTLFVFLAIVVIVVIVVALIDLISKSSKSNLKRVLSLATAIILMLMLTCTGVIDAITLYNNDTSPGTTFSLNDPLIKWASEKTGPNEIFLISPAFTHRILMAGRKVFLGGAYFNMTAGYLHDERYEIVKQIYGGTNPLVVKKILKEQRITYVVIESDNMVSPDYKLNVNLFKNNFELVYSEGGTDIYKANK